MSTDGVYCKWCGTLVTGGGLFCPSCGREVEDLETARQTTYRAHMSSPREDESEESSGQFAKLSGVFARGVALVIALFVTLIGTALPLLIVVALFIGPGDTWDAIRGWMPGGGNDNAACAGFANWYEDSADRSQQLMGMMEDYQSDSSADSASILSLASAADSFADEQRLSNPPQEALVLNGMMVETLELTADALRTVAGSDQVGLQNRMYEAEQLTLQLNAEEDRVFDVCG